MALGADVESTARVPALDELLALLGQRAGPAARRLQSRQRPAQLPAAGRTSCGWAGGAAGRAGVRGAGWGSAGRAGGRQGAGWGLAGAGWGVSEGRGCGVGWGRLGSAGAGWGSVGAGWGWAGDGDTRAWCPGGPAAHVHATLDFSLEAGKVLQEVLHVCQAVAHAGEGCDLWASTSRADLT